MLDHEGNIAEATGANIFFKNNIGELHTPTTRLIFRWNNKKMYN